MKNQYFADARDFYKYDLLLHLMGLPLGFEQLVMGWWLTPDDDSTDGEVRDYKVGLRDQALHDWLQERHHRQHRDVRQFAEFPGVVRAAWRYTQALDHVPLDSQAREAYVDSVAALGAGSPSLVFLDPDNGLMTKSATYSKRPKYVDYPEVGRILRGMHRESLLVVFQYLPRMSREVFYPAALQRLRDDAGAEHAQWLSPDNLVTYFLIAAGAERLASVHGQLAPYLARLRFHATG
jgi:hypothetical protein